MGEGGGTATDPDAGSANSAPVLTARVAKGARLPSLLPWALTVGVAKSVCVLSLLLVLVAAGGLYMVTGSPAVLLSRIAVAWPEMLSRCVMTPPRVTLS